MTFQLLSDLHLEFYPDFKSKTLPQLLSSVDILILAGDICEARNFEKFSWFFDWCNSNYSKTFYILGNHEFYNSNNPILLLNKTNGNEIGKKLAQAKVTMPELLFEEMCKINKLSNITFLKDFKEIEIGEDIIIMGDICWTNFENNNKTSKLQCEYLMNDSRRGGTSVEWSYFQHIEAIKKLEINLQNSKNKKVVIVTHHPITKDCVHLRFKDSEINGGFTSNYNEFILHNPNILAICSGHTHDKWSGKIGDITKYHINPLGYPGESINTIIKPYIFEV